MNKIKEFWQVHSLGDYDFSNEVFNCFYIKLTTSLNNANIKKLCLPKIIYVMVVTPGAHSWALYIHNMLAKKLYYEFVLICINLFWVSFALWLSTFLRVGWYCLQSKDPLTSPKSNCHTTHQSNSFCQEQNICLCHLNIWKRHNIYSLRQNQLLDCLFSPKQNNLVGNNIYNLKN